MEQVKAGCFTPEQSTTNVCVEEFSIGKFEVTFKEYDAFEIATSVGFYWDGLPSDSGFGRDRRPVINVSWHDATDYADWLSKELGENCSLPSDTEWEYAARGGSTDRYHWGKTDNDAARYAVYGAAQPEPVGTREPNDFGLHDTAGNVWEWVADHWSDDYPQHADGERWVSEDENADRVLRGGSWGYHSFSLRASNRGRGQPEFRSSVVGFRVLCRPHR